MLSSLVTRMRAPWYLMSYYCTGLFLHLTRTIIIWVCTPRVSIITWSILSWLTGVYWELYLSGVNKAGNTAAHGQLEFELLEDRWVNCTCLDGCICISSTFLLTFGRARMFFFRSNAVSWFVLLAIHSLSFIILVFWSVKLIVDDKADLFVSVYQWLTQILNSSLDML